MSSSELPRFTSQEALSFNSEHRLRAENLSYDIDVWYPRVEQHTFKSTFFPLKIEEAKAILAFHDVSWRNISTKPYLTKQEISILKELEATLDRELKKLLETNGKTYGFVRLCGRSPKDGEPLHRQVIADRYQQELHRLIHEEGFLDIANTKMIAVTRTAYMKIQTGQEAMSLLLTSERVFAEMIDWIQFGEPEQICLRIYEDDLSMDYEFRVFYPLTLLYLKCC